MSDEESRPLPAAQEPPSPARPAAPAEPAAPAQDAVEFLPDALEIAQERLPWYARVGVFWCGFLIAAVLAWACLAKVDVIVRAPGRLTSEQGRIVMKPKESAVIRSIEVREGDVVEAGQVLLTFDPEITRAEVERLRLEVALLEAELARYTAEFEGRDFATGDSRNAHWQQEIFRQRKRYYEEKLKNYDGNRRRLEAEHKAAKESHQKYREILANMERIEKMYLALREKNVVSVKETLEVAISRMENEAAVDRYRNQIAQVEQELLALEADRNAFIESWVNGISEKMVEVRRELDGTRKQLEKALSLATYVNICAPCRAIVHELASFPVGSAVGEAEALITLVPLDGTLEVEAEVRPQDIARIAVGSQARVKLSAFPFQKHGTLAGEVRLISGNTFQRSMPAGTQEYYRVHVGYHGELHNLGPKPPALLPGMEAEVEIKTGRRRVIEYLIHPILKGLDEAFREP